MKIFRAMIVLLLGALSPSAFAALQYDAVAEIAAAPAEKVEAGAPGGDANAAHVTIDFDTGYSAGLGTPVSSMRPKSPPRGQPLPGVLVTLFAGMLISGGTRYFCSRKGGCGPAELRKRGTTSSVCNFAVPGVSFPVRPCCRCQKIVLRL